VEIYVNNLEKDSALKIGFIPMEEKLKSNEVTKETLDKIGVRGFPLEDGSEIIPTDDVVLVQQRLLDSLVLEQPFVDHPYTTVYGRRLNSFEVCNKLKALEMADFDDEAGPSKPWSIYDYPFISKSMFLVPESGQKGKKPTPILFLRHRSPDENVPMVSKEEIIDLEKNDEKEGQPKVVYECGVPLPLDRRFCISATNEEG